MSVRAVAKRLDRSWLLHNLRFHFSSHSIWLRTIWLSLSTVFFRFFFVYFDYKTIQTWSNFAVNTFPIYSIDVSLVVISVRFSSFDSLHIVSAVGRSCFSFSFVAKSEKFFFVFCLFKFEIIFIFRFDAFSSRSRVQCECDDLQIEMKK